MTELAEGVHVLRVPNPRMGAGPGAASVAPAYTLVYLVATDSGWTMVDAGWNTTEGFEELLRQLEDAKIPLHDIVRIIVTHSHPDHLGMAGRLRKESGAALVVHPGVRNSLMARAADRMGESGRRRLGEWLLAQGFSAGDLSGFARMEDSETAKAWQFNDAEPDLVVQDREQLPVTDGVLEVLWTPGHSPDHICLYEPERRLLFTGDHVLPRITPNVSLFPFVQSDPLGEYLASLNRVRDLEVAEALPAHEYPFSDLRQRIGELERHHEERLGEVRSALLEGPHTAFEIAATMRWNIGDWPELTSFTRFMALMETRAHVEHLVRLGRVQMFLRDGVNQYEWIRASD